MEEARFLIRLDPSKPIKRVYDEIIIDHQRRQVGRAQDEPEYSSVRSNLNRYRSGLMPPIPRTVEEAARHLQGTNGQTWRNER